MTLLMMLSPLPHSTSSVEDKPERSAVSVRADLPRDVYMTIVTSGNSPDKLEKHKEDVATAFHNSSESIANATDGELSINLVDVDSVNEQPKDTYVDKNRGTEEPCFSFEQSNRIVKDVTLKKGLAESAVVALYFADGVNCHKPNSAHFVVRGSNRYLTFDKGNLGAINHEMGHLWGLPHNEKYRINVANTTREPSSDDFVDLCQELTYVSEVDYNDRRRGDYDRINSKDPEVIEQREESQEYSSDLSIMGSQPSSDHRYDLFTPDERSQLAPNRFRMVDWNGQPGEYVLSIREGGISGVRVPVPEGSPLKEQVDSSIHSLFFGLRASGENTDNSRHSNDSLLDLVITARGKDRTYTIGGVTGILPHNDAIKEDIEKNSRGLTGILEDYNNEAHQVYRDGQIISSISGTGVLRIDTLDSFDKDRQKMQEFEINDPSRMACQSQAASQ